MMHDKRKIMVMIMRKLHEKDRGREKKIVVDSLDIVMMKHYWLVSTFFFSVLKCFLLDSVYYRFLKLHSFRRGVVWWEGRILGIFHCGNFVGIFCSDVARISVGFFEFFRELFQSPPSPLRYPSDEFLWLFA